jgi:hypothetical protein
MCHKLARLSAALFLTAGACGMSHGEIVRYGVDDSNVSGSAAIAAPVAFTTAIPDPVVQFLDSSLHSTDLNPSPRQVLHEEPVTAPAVESQMVPLPESFWTGMTGLLGLGVIHAAKRVRKTFL